MRSIFTPQNYDCSFFLFVFWFSFFFFRWDARRGDGKATAEKNPVSFPISVPFARKDDEKPSQKVTPGIYQKKKYKKNGEKNTIVLHTG